MNRVILHIDLDYFYAQAEEVRKPELKGKPVVVCMFSGRTEFSGAVAAANYAARALGIHAGMPIAFAKKKGPQAVFLPADRAYYEEVSGRIMETLREFSDSFEQVSVDEAFLDASKKCAGSFAGGKRVAREIKKRILEEEKLTCSIGIGPNKLIAKMASGQKKPDGLTVVAGTEVKEFLRSKRISDLYGVGEKTVEALAQRGIMTIRKLAEAPVQELQEMFGENRGIAFHEKALGIDESPVEERERQQLSRIITLKEDTQDPGRLIEESWRLAEELAAKASGMNVAFRTVSVLLISNKLENVTRSRTLPMLSQKKEEILSISAELLREFFAENKGFIARRFGLRVSGLERPQSQKKLAEFS